MNLWEFAPLARGLVPITGANNIKARTILLCPLEERDLWLSGTRMHGDCTAVGVVILCAAEKRL